MRKQVWAICLKMTMGLGAVPGLCQTAAATPENPDEDRSLRSVYVRCQRNMQRPNFEELYPRDSPLPENIYRVSGSGRRQVVLDDMDRAVIPDFKGYWPPGMYHGHLGHLPGDRVYSYHGRLTTKREDIYQFMRDELIVNTKQAMNSEQCNLSRYRSLIAEALETLRSSANAKAERP